MLIYRYINMSQEWFILQYKSNSHQIAKKNLNQQMFKTFLPQYDTATIKASRFKSAVQPLFPGYMFVMFDRSNTKWHKINNTYGVSRLITFNSILRPVPKLVIKSFLLMILVVLLHSTTKAISIARILRKLEIR